MEQTHTKTRFVTLDILRGFFMLVIIIDHLNRWPSLLAWVTGQGRLWVSAGEGFFIISGILVGYTRGYKKLNLPFKKVVGLLYSRAALLYLSAVIASALLLLLTLQGTFPAELQPSVVVPKNSLTAAVWQILTLRYVFEWVYFLKLYIAALVMAPLAIWLLRKRQTFLVALLSVLTWALGIFVKQDWLQWQVLFFIPATLGFHLVDIRLGWQTLSSQTQGKIKWGVWIASGLTLLLSCFWVFGWELVKGPHAMMSFDSYLSARRTIDPLFAKVQLSMGRILLAFVWFTGLYLLVSHFENSITKWIGKFLIPFGQRSLTFYILHGFILMPIQIFAPMSSNQFYNLALGLSLVIMVFALGKNKILQKVIPS
jgi:hypothetical protein